MSSRDLARSLFREGVMVRRLSRVSPYDLLVGWIPQVLLKEFKLEFLLLGNSRPV